MLKNFFSAMLVVVFFVQHAVNPVFTRFEGYGQICNTPANPPAVYVSAVYAYARARKKIFFGVGTVLAL